MAGDTLRGDGLVKAQRALAKLEGDSLQLDRERQRFSHSPPPHISNPSGTTTRSQSPNPPSEEQRLRQKRRMQLGQERITSKPHEQFSHQTNEEEKRVFEASLNGTHRIPVGSDPRTIARENVKKRWVEQGIWNSKWNQFAYGRWKHEEPLELESESLEAGPSPPLFSFSPKQPKRRRPKSDDEKRRIAERRVVREREREASRPYHQFVYQISKERERIQDESANREGASAADINTTAYENVKNTWIKRGIWNKRWGILPGISWKHEEPLEEEAADGPAPVPANPLVNDSYEAGEAPAIRIFGFASPVESNHRQVSSALNSSRSENVDAEHPPSTSNSPPPSSGKRVLRPTTGQASRPSLGPIHSSKVSKVAGKKKLKPQQRLNVDAVEPQPSPPPDRVTPRRSKRIQPPVPKDPAKTVSTNLLKRSKPERKVASNLTKSSAKPQGVLKRQHAKTTRGKARKK